VSPAGKVLVFGEDTRSFLAIVRSLGRRGVVVHAAPANLRAPALASRYVACVHALPPWMGDGTAWLEAVEALLCAERFDLVIPCNETALLPLQLHRARLGALARLAIPDDNAIAVLFDKHATRTLAQRLGIPVPEGRLPRPGENADATLAALGAPVVVKPRRSYVLGRLERRGKVQFARDAAELARLLPELHAEEHVLERFFPGQGLGVSLLASGGRVLQAFEHHRVRENDSGSYYRVSAPLTPALLAACADLVAALQYTGVGMFEFRRDERTRAWVLLEVNARPWGSMPLPLGLGVDFPWRWYRLLTAGEESPAVGYRVGVFGRNLVPDLQSVLAEARGRGAGRLAPLGRWLLELGRVATGREIHDVLVRDDPRPALVEFGQVVGEAARRGAARLPGWAALARLRARARLRAALRRADAGGIGLVFVCLGNICRSPFAAALLQARLAGRRSVRIVSAGMLPQSDRPTPPFGVQAAAAHGIDLAQHRSVWLSRTEAAAATVLVVFDEATRRALLDRYPDLHARVVKLGDLLDGAEIADPVDGDGAVFAATYAAIAAAVAELGRLVGPFGG
jgi:protein-tyrosine-phosphatase/predicted ATP-grasp superfamily ATP-dependent carboligase